MVVLLDGLPNSCFPLPGYRIRITLVCKLHAALPDSFAPRFITHYASACLAAKDNDVFGTYRELCHAVRIGAAGKALFSNDSGALKLWHCALQQAFAIDPKHPALISAPPALPFHHAEPSMPVSFSQVAMENISSVSGQRFLASAAPLDGLRCHIHVVNPTRKTDALFTAWKTRATAELSYSSDEVPKIHLITLARGSCWLAKLWIARLQILS